VAICSIILVIMATEDFSSWSRGRPGGGRGDDELVRVVAAGVLAQRVGPRACPVPARGPLVPKAGETSQHR